MKEKRACFDHKEFLAQVPHHPGVYHMYAADGKMIYVGKAKDLKKRLSSYFRQHVDSKKTASLVAMLTDVHFTLTKTETEALLLEHNYIKQYQPRYNVLLRDDKSYPYIRLSKSKHPRVSVYRGAKQGHDDFFGPYPNATSVRDTMGLLQKLFPIRQCKDSFYQHRSRPCLQYQIKRCLAPCVSGYVTDEEYAKQVSYVRLFLSGNDSQVINRLINDMEMFSESLQFEKAARIRDLIQSIRTVSEKQSIENSQDNIDIIGSAYEHGTACIYLLFIRNGKILGHRTYFPKVPPDTSIEEIIETFVGQFYLEGNPDRTLPQQIILDQPLSNKLTLAQSISQHIGRKITLSCQSKGKKGKTLTLATMNAQMELRSKQAAQSTYLGRYKALKTLFKIAALERIECFDISHMMGEKTVASCVVFGKEGAIRAEFRRYNITGITGGDDYAAMEQVLTRRYSKDLADNHVPDLIFIDGGKGQLKRAEKVFDSLDVDWDKSRPLLIGIAKGAERKEGLETLYLHSDDNGFYSEPNDPALLLIQQIRNASHDHAIIGHRKQKQKITTSSLLETIDGVGAKRRQQLLKYMGGLHALSKATVDQIAQIPGISHALAEKIHLALKQ